MIVRKKIDGDSNGIVIIWNCCQVEVLLMDVVLYSFCGIDFSFVDRMIMLNLIDVYNLNRVIVNNVYLGDISQQGGLEIFMF